MGTSRREGRRASLAVFMPSNWRWPGGGAGEKERVKEDREELGLPDVEEELRRERTKSHDGLDEAEIVEVVDEVIEETEEIVS